MPRIALHGLEQQLWRVGRRRTAEDGQHLIIPCDTTLSDMR